MDFSEESNGPIQKENLPKWYLHNDEPEQINTAAAVEVPVGGKKKTLFSPVASSQSIFSRPDSWLHLALDETSGGGDCVGGSQTDHQ